MTNPLSKADINNLHKTVVQLQDAQQHIDMAKRAGIDVSEHEARHDHLKGLAHAMLQVYGPQGPPKVE